MTTVRWNGWELDEIDVPPLEVLQVVVGDGRPWVEACEPPGTGVVLGLTLFEHGAPSVRFNFDSIDALRKWIQVVAFEASLEAWVEEAAPNP